MHTRDHLSHRAPHGRWLLALLVALLSLPPSLLRATDIEGVQPAALDQPRVNVLLRRTSKDKPLAAKASGDLLGLAGSGNVETFNIQAFLDTGASGILLSKHTADALGIQRLTAPDPAGHAGRQPARQEVVFHDVGVAGGDEFDVSEPLYAWLAPFAPATDTESPDHYRQQVANAFRAQIGPLNLGAGLLEQLVLADLDVFGTPAMAGKVVVMDPRPVNGFDDTMRTYIYAPGTPFNPAQARSDPGIPPTHRHVKLSYVSFEPFTSTTPAGAPGPTMAANPFIGPDPTRARARASGPADNTPSIVVVHGGKRSAGSWLLDTGAAASMISKKQAAAVGITYVAGTEDTNDPVLSKVPKDKQFTLTVGGIGGQKKSAGFFLDELRVPTAEGDTLVYKGAPVLVADITVEDPATGRQVTLDGVFGMNFLVASAHVSEGLLPDIGQLTPGPFDWVVYDQPRGILGVELRK